MGGRGTYLAGHDFSIGTRYFHAGKEARFIVSFNNIAAKRVSDTHSTIVWALRSRKAILGPAKRGLCVLAEQGIFLLEAKPGF